MFGLFKKKEPLKKESKREFLEKFYKDFFGESFADFPFMKQKIDAMVEQTKLDEYARFEG